MMAQQFALINEFGNLQIIFCATALSYLKRPILSKATDSDLEVLEMGTN